MHESNSKTDWIDTMYDEIKQTEAYLKTRKRLAYRMAASLEQIATDLERGLLLDASCTDMVFQMLEYCDRILLAPEKGMN